MAPIILPPNQPANRFYRGGARISAFRSAPPCGEYEPEDWVASTTCCHGQDSLGLTRLDDGTLLVDEIQNNAERWLGPDHIKAFGTSTKILVKLLGAGQRLPVHAHPHRDWAKRYLGATCGKAELWFVLEAGVVHLGLREAITSERLGALVEGQEVDTLLGMMHEMRVERYQTVFVPPGLLHAIGEGMLIAEVQEPSDLSVLCEWRDFAVDGAQDGHLGLGFEVALTAVEKSARTGEEIEALMTGADVKGLVGGPQTRDYFTVERHSVKNSESSSFAPGFAVLILFEGDELQMMTAAGARLTLCKGNTVVVPYAEGVFYLKGKGEVLISRPPSPP